MYNREKCPVCNGKVEYYGRYTWDSCPYEYNEISCINIVCNFKLGFINNGEHFYNKIGYIKDIKIL